MTQKYDLLPEAARRLARVPRTGRLIARLPSSRLGRLRNNADVYWEVYTFQTRDGRGDCGLLADGLKTERARRLAWRGGGDPPDSEDFRSHQVKRAAALLGAIAFEMMAMGDQPVYAIEDSEFVHSAYTAFRQRVRRRFLEAEAYVDEDGLPEPPSYWGVDWECLLAMDSHGLKHFIFSSDARDQQLRWTDITTMAFFAAYWACRWARPEELLVTRQWVIDPLKGTNDAYREFWTFAAELPEEAIDPDRWVALFTPLYDGSLPIRSTEFIFRTWERMQGTNAQQQFLAEFPALLRQRNAVALGLKESFRPIPGDKFLMGSPAEEKGRSKDETQHPVEVSAFRMLAFPVTIPQFELFAPAHKDHRWEGPEHPAGKEAGDHPVVNVSWFDAWCFAQWTGNYLPSEAQWEYACRGGARSYQPFHFGNTLSLSQANFNGKFDWGDADVEGSVGRPTQVGSYPANDFGLHHMHGNVWEWCEDWYSAAFYTTDTARGLDPVNQERASARVLRGGSWFNFGGRCRSASRGRFTPPDRFRYCGFRLAAVPAAVGAQPGKQK